MKPRYQKVLIALGVVCLLFSCYLAFLNYTEPTEVGIARNAISGEMWTQEGGGWHGTLPWVRVATIDLRPVRVSVQSAGRGYSSKLVQFEVRGWREFVATEGFRYYWWANRLSINFGYEDEHRGMKDILRGYAYGGNKYPFISILSDIDVRTEK